MLDKMSDTSRIVDRMVIKGLVMKNISPADKRMVDITISNKGQQVLQEIDKYESQMDDIMKNMTENEAETLNLLLDKLRNA
jgi:DNA-binding MarR family transcriptional regulator